MGLRERFRKNRAEVRERDERWLMRIDFIRVRKALFRLLIAFILLSFMDIVTTLTALSNTSIFKEDNPIAFGFFQHQFLGFVLAIAFKFVVLIPLVYGVFMSESGKNQIQVRTIKLAVLVTLGAADILLIAVVVSNLGTLIAGLG